MKLKKTWMGICVFVIYTVGIIFATGVTGFISGLFPVYDKRMVTALIVLALAVAALVVSAVGVTIGKAINKNVSDEIKWVPEIILPVILFVAAAFVYIRYINGIIPVTGNMQLFESALVTKDRVVPAGGSFIDSLYIMGLNFLMSFLGNELRAVLAYQLVFRMIMLISLYFALRNTIGIFGALAGSIATVAIPLFGFSIKHVYAGNLFFACLMLVLMLVVLYAKGISGTDRIKPGHVILGIIIGALTGFAVYIDIAAITVIVFMIAALFSDDEAFSFRAAFIDFIVFIVAGLLAFGCSVYFLGGMRPFYVSFFEYANRFYGINKSAWFASVSASWWNLVISFGMLGGAIAVIFSFIFSKRNERIVPWLLFTVLSCVLSVVCGRTVINYDMYLFLMLAILTGCAVSCFAYKEKEVVAEAITKEDVVEASDVKTQEDVKAVDDVTETEDAEKEAEDKESREVVMPVENKITEDAPEDNKPRFVPEGMVLPTGEEDEENLVPHFNMNRPETENIGILSVGKPEEKIKKDDFDITIDPDDDFDI
jgi:hypothetical protein